MKNKLLVIGTLIVAVILVALMAGYSPGESAKSIDTSGQLQLGKPGAKVKVVLFIDLRCGTCQYYEEQIFPLIKRRYIDNNLIEYTVIPIAFLNGSTRLATGYYCTRQQKPDLGMDYIQATYAKDDVPYLPGINSGKLDRCIGSTRAHQYVENNMEIAEKAMGKHKVATPTLYVNGVKVSEPTYTAISNAINEALE